MSEEMAKAQQRIEQAEQANFIRFLKNVEIREASPLVITNDSAALNALDRATNRADGSLGISASAPLVWESAMSAGKTSTEIRRRTIVPTPGGAKPRALPILYYGARIPWRIGGKVQQHWRPVDGGI